VVSQQPRLSLTPLGAATPAGAISEDIPAVCIAGRFRVVSTLGVGGMATVYEVLDLVTNQRLALKRLREVSDPRKRRRTVELFEREFYTLSHLAHPRVVSAFDYGVDEAGPYYTMELLEGGELQQLSPLPWRQACSIGRDICSALSILHSRRQVFRDLNPRNVRCSPDGTAKLIDFGALSNMGPSKQVVGTPGYCAPEALDFQPLDARTDLYSLGATLYFTLTGRHAYPANNFEQLRRFWESSPLRPAELVPDIPFGLDALVMDLLHADPGLRPASAAEVMEQLGVIEGRTFEELPQVESAYLSAPNLVGRDATLSRARAKLSRALRQRGGSMLITGASGVGRSRLLMACLLEAKLHGALVLRADSSDADDEYAVLRALCAQLLESASETTLRAAAPHCAVLSRVLPGLNPSAPESIVDPEPNDRLRAEFMVVFKDWLLAICAQRALVIAIDDLHAIDEPSAAALSLLAHDASKEALLIIATVEDDVLPTAPSALKLLANTATSLALTNLSAANTEELLRSVFGDVPHVQMVAHKLHAITQGNPRDLVQLAQYLVDKRVATYRAGTWSLPASIDSADLPSSMAQALQTRAQGLSACARRLARYMTLSAGRTLSFDECVGLCPDTPAPDVLEALAELQQSQVTSVVGDAYTVPQRGIVAALQADLDSETRRNMHRALAVLFQQRGDEEFRRAQQLQRAGEDQQGLDVLLEHAAKSQAATEADAQEYYKLLRGLPEDWFDVYATGLRLCKELGRPQQQSFVLRSRLAGLVDVMSVPGDIGYPPLHALLQLLYEESGLQDFAALDSNLEAMARLKSAIETAQARYTARAADDRVFDPLSAIKQLTRACIAVTGLAAKTIDYALWSSIPCLKPLVALSPAIGAADRLTDGVGARITARMEQARAAYIWLVDLTETPGKSGLGESNHRYLRYGVMFGLGTIEACMGLQSALQWASAIEQEPTHQVNAQLVRMLFHLWQGQVREADQIKEEIELMRIRNSPRQWLEGAHLFGQVAATALSDDLTRIKQTLHELEPLAARQAPWVPVRDYALGEYHRIRGDLNEAVKILSAVMSNIQAGRHQIWPFAAAAHTRVLNDLGQHESARDHGQRYVVEGEQAALGYMVNYVKLPLAIALANTENFADAVRTSDETLLSFRELGTSGLNLVIAYETRARVALLAKDQSAYNEYAKLCADCVRGTKSRLLLAKHEKLKQAALAAEVQVKSLLLFSDIDSGRIRLTSVLLGSHNPNERAQKSLELLLLTSRAKAGFLYLLGENGLELCAESSGIEAPEGLANYVSEYFEAQVHEREVHTQSVDAGQKSIETLWTSELGERLRPLLLAHQSPEGFAVTGVVVLIEHAKTPFVFPGATVTQLSKLAAESGDANVTIVE
jgi:hypothetical protein